MGVFYKDFPLHSYFDLEYTLHVLFFPPHPIKAVIFHDLNDSIFSQKIEFINILFLLSNSENYEESQKVLFCSILLHGQVALALKGLFLIIIFNLRREGPKGKGH